MNVQAVQQAQIDALNAIRPLLQHGTRLFINGQVIIITISGPDLKPGVPDAPSDVDIDAAIKQLLTLKKVAAKTREEAQCNKTM